MIVGGVDLGFTGDNPLGFVVWDTDVQKLLVAEMFTSKAKAWEDRVDEAGDWLYAMFGSIHVDVVSYEMVINYGGKDPQTPIKLAHLAGIVRRVARTRFIPIVHVTPAQAKMILAGSGKADKDTMMQAAEKKYNVVMPKDLADALGMAVTGHMKLIGTLPVPQPKKKRKKKVPDAKK